MDDQELDYGDDYDGHFDEDHHEDADTQGTTFPSNHSTKTTQRKNVTRPRLAALRKELGATGGDTYLRAVYVKGVDGMQDYQIERMFSTFHNAELDRLDDTSALVHFMTRHDAAAMLLNMTKALRRVRAKKRADEEGEVISEGEEEEGQIMSERGDDVAVVDDDNRPPREVSKEFVTVDVDVVDVPHGRWRVITQHVAQQRFLIVRYATTNQVEAARKKRINKIDESLAKKRKVIDNGFWTSGDRVRPGLNIFDKDGNELEWDYEHDTRFFDDSEKRGARKSLEKKEDKFEMPKTVKVRGRGAVKSGFLYGADDSTSLTSDESKEIKRRRKQEEETKYTKDDVLSRVAGSRLEGRISFN
ncbi:unnamed protein product [Caenorhabditis auriculariae]|uniref:Uncharacterized protein n=1 Tax=Caenorhabditis auriculariae TaxID=2777116 RepID=A0A8S1I0A1_9PELO|nr:unnamed protein product [Caenorhabditis auriculariae]